MAKRKKKNVSRNPEVTPLRHRKLKGGSKTIGNLRQFRYKKPFRISAPYWPPELLKAIEREIAKPTNGEEQLTTKAKGMTTSETKVPLPLIAEFATGLWRIRRKTFADDSNELTRQMRPICRHVESTWDALTSADVEIRDHTGEKYITGMALKVIAFQPTSSVKVETITETIKPSVFYKDKLIQRGEVIVETPEEQQSDQESPTEVASETASSNSSQKRVENGGKERNRTDNT